MNQLILWLWVTMNCVGVSVWAEAGEAEAAPRAFQVFPEAVTLFPVLAGVGPGASIQEHFQVGIHYGLTPGFYYETIAGVAADLAGNASYENIINAAFRNNSLWRFSFQYNFLSVRRGWRIGIAAMILSSSGQADIDQVLSAATGQDYTALKTFLIASGRSPTVDMTSTLWLAEIRGGYAWELVENLSLSAWLGIVKVFSSVVRLKTGLPAFEASAAGSALLRTTEGDLESILNKYGISPVLGVSASYAF